MTQALLDARIGLATAYAKANEATEIARVACVKTKDAVLKFDVEHPEIMRAVQQSHHDAKNKWAAERAAEAEATAAAEA